VPVGIADTLTRGHQARITPRHTAIKGRNSLLPRAFGGLSVPVLSPGALTPAPAEWNPEAQLQVCAPSQGQLGKPSRAARSPGTKIGPVSSVQNLPYGTSAWGIAFALHTEL